MQMLVQLIQTLSQGSTTANLQIEGTGKWGVN